MGYFKSHKFCCCVPVRVGVFIMAVFGSLGGLAIAIVGWFSVTRKDQSHLTTNQDISLIMTSLSYTVFTILSICGLIGAIIKHRGLISMYSMFAFWHLGFSIVTGAFFIYTLFHKVGSRDVSNCVNGSTDPNAQDDCKRAFDVVRGVAIAISIISWLFEFWGYLIVAEYASQLEEEEAVLYPPPAQMAATVPPISTTYNYRAQYAFSQPENSFGQPNVNNV